MIIMEMEQTSRIIMAVVAAVDLPADQIRISKPFKVLEQDLVDILFTFNNLV